MDVAIDDIGHVVTDDIAPQGISGRSDERHIRAVRFEQPDDLFRIKPVPGDRAGDDPLKIRRRHCPARMERSEEHTSELQSLMRISYAVFCLKKNNKSKANT